MARLLTALLPDPEGMLTHLPHFEVENTADALSVLEKPLLVDQWVVFHFQFRSSKNPKAVLYGRSRVFRERGIDSMVRQLVNGRFVLVVRRYA